jgi:hypothetical protein
MNVEREAKPFTHRVDLAFSAQSAGRGIASASAQQLSKLLPDLCFLGAIGRSLPAKLHGDATLRRARPRDEQERKARCSEPDAAFHGHGSSRIVTSST